MNSDQQNRYRGGGSNISVSSMRKELIKNNIDIDKDADLASLYQQFLQEKGVYQPNQFSTPSEQNRENGQRQSHNLPPPKERQQSIQGILNMIDHSKEKKNNQNYVFVDQHNSDVTQGQSSNQMPNRNDIASNQNMQIPEEAEINQSSARQSRFQAFNFGQQNQSGRNSLQNNRASSASMNSNRLSGNQNGLGLQNQQQRISNEGGNRSQQEIQSYSPVNYGNFNFRMSNQIYSPGINNGIRSSSNGMMNNQQGYFINENSSKRVSNQSYNNFNQIESANRRSQQLNSPVPQTGKKNSLWKNGEEINDFAGSAVFNRHQYTPNYPKSTSITDTKWKGLLDTARELSQKKQRQSNDSMMNISQYNIFSNKKSQVESRKSENIAEVDTSFQYLSQQQKLNIKDKVLIFFSKIEISHIVMFIMVGLFCIFFLQNIYDFLTHTPELEYCDSTLRQEQIEGSSCIPCPQNAICLNNNIKCKHSFVLIDKKCVTNPQIEPNTIRYLSTVVQNLQYLQAQYHCYDSNSSGYGNNLSRPYKEHKWESIVNILTIHHSKDLLFYDTLTKVKDYLKSKSIREQFDINYDSLRDTYYVTTFNPSYYCRIRLWSIQNVNIIIAVLCIFFLIFLLYQVAAVRRFIYFFKLYRIQQKIVNENKIQQQNNSLQQDLNKSIKDNQQLYQQGGQVSQRFASPQNSNEQSFSQRYSQQQNPSQQQQIKLLSQQQFLQVPQNQQNYLQIPSNQQQQQQQLKLDNSLLNLSQRRGKLS
ncbi:Man1-Src1p-carboxy-terminal domain protein (macronuclear) [Tetrahymena thermophila SB210]|uniref:Man1-Src1p-carboxy-terminal domain protein n=1 Tax=Tetrahymena thermophila (strain SB210) TaxID=312017 RepID=I7MDT6_TETTS|nr:Man1-Src1p-carboxy-terminal domain protein [Tetrahymena thermophila SB210]EAR90926.3 Man1-Src1p-carboxy-terminal domain protein [Tetrahymena thermophila SB210]|eukprot:XP_001011171.3 Man1-Src1p-carboxy-terminal domain protein [Tetrahymena thermophila SB210]